MQEQERRRLKRQQQERTMQELAQQALEQQRESQRRLEQAFVRMADRGWAPAQGELAWRLYFQISFPQQ